MNILGTLITGTNTGARFLGQDRHRLKDENVFINLKCSFLFDFMFYVLTHDCVVQTKIKPDKSPKFIAKRVISPFKSESLYLFKVVKKN